MRTIDLVNPQYSGCKRAVGYPLYLSTDCSTVYVLVVLPEHMWTEEEQADVKAGRVKGALCYVPIVLLSEEAATALRVHTVRVIHGGLSTDAARLATFACQAVIPATGTVHWGNGFADVQKTDFIERLVLHKSEAKSAGAQPQWATAFRDPVLLVRRLHFTVYSFPKDLMYENLSLVPCEKRVILRMDGLFIDGKSQSEHIRLVRDPIGTGAYLRRFQKGRRMVTYSLEWKGDELRAWKAPLVAAAPAAAAAAAASAAAPAAAVGVHSDEAFVSFSPIEEEAEVGAAEAAAPAAAPVAAPAPMTSNKRKPEVEVNDDENFGPACDMAPSVPGQWAPMSKKAKISSYEAKGMSAAGAAAAAAVEEDHEIFNKNILAEMDQMYNKALTDARRDIGRVFPKFEHHFKLLAEGGATKARVAMVGAALTCLADYAGFMRRNVVHFARSPSSLVPPKHFAPSSVKPGLDGVKTPRKRMWAMLVKCDRALKELATAMDASSAALELHSAMYCFEWYANFMRDHIKDTVVVPAEKEAGAAAAAASDSSN